MLEPLQRTTLTEAIIERIRNLILEGVWPPGTKLPSERELSEQFAVARTSVREALRALALLGLIEVRPGDGTYVATDSIELAMRPISWALLTDRQRDTLFQLYEARKLLEVELAELAARRATPEDLATMETAIARMEQCLGDPLEFAKADLDFHMAVARAGDNLILMKLVSAIRGLCLEAINTVLHIPDTAERALAYHRDVLAALQDRDPQRARTAMFEHLDNVEQVLRQVYQQPTADQHGTVQEVAP